MDYGRRAYGSESKDYMTYMSEITDQYVSSIGGIVDAGTKRPYMYDSYQNMMYLNNEAKYGITQYLGGSPMDIVAYKKSGGLEIKDRPIIPYPTIERLKMNGIKVSFDDLIPEEVSQTDTNVGSAIFALDFEGAYTDSIQGLSPVLAFGNSIDYSVYHDGQSSLLLQATESLPDSSILYGVIGWYPIGYFNPLSFIFSFYFIGSDFVGAADDGQMNGYMAIGYDTGSLVMRLYPSGSLTIGHEDSEGVPMIQHNTTWANDTWYKCVIAYNDGLLTAKINDDTIINEVDTTEISSVISTVAFVQISAFVSTPNLWIDTVMIECN